MMIEKHTQHAFSKVEIKDYHVVIDGQNFLNKPGKGDLRIHCNIKKLQLVKEMVIEMVVY